MDWQIDGALALSAYQGDYIGYHKDLDISVEVSDMPELQQRAFKHGFGLFMGELYRDDQGEIQTGVVSHYKND